MMYTKSAKRPGRLAATVILALILAGCTAVQPAPKVTAPAGSSAGAAGKAPAGTAQPDTTAAPAPGAAYVGKMSVAPKHGPAGTLVTVTGSGLPANTAMDLVWNTVKGTWVLQGNAREEFHGRKFETVAVPLSKVTTDAQGNVQAQFKAPDDYGFIHDVTLVEQGVVRNKAAFSLDMQVAVSPQSGPAGTPITIDVQGEGWQSLENSWTVLYDNQFTGLLSAVTTAGKARAVIPAAGMPGKHLITIVHGSMTVPYLNGQQSPSPDRPTWNIPFTVTEGEAVQPPAATTQGLPPQPGKAPEGTAPAVWANYSTGPVGLPLEITARGLTPKAAVQFTWSRVTGNRVSGKGWSENSVPLGQATAGDDGVARLNVPVPDDLGGPHTVGVLQGDKEIAAGSFTITPSAFALSVGSGPVGTDFVVHLKGVGWTETANIYNVNYDNGFMGYVCGFNSKGDVQIPMKATGTPGWHYIDLFPGIYKGQDAAGVQNYRIPQLTYADDHPGEKLPAFHFAFLVTP